MTDQTKHFRQTPDAPARRIAEGALMVALSTILGLAAFYLPLLNLLLLAVYPIPLAYLIKRHGPLVGLTAFLASAALLMIFLGPANAAFVVLSMGAVGLWYGVAWRYELRPLLSLGVGVVLAAISVVVTLLLSLWTMGVSLAGIDAYIGQYVDEVLQLMQSSGLYDKLSLGVSLSQYGQMMTELLTELIPAMLVIAAMAEALLCYLIAGAVFRRLGLSISTLPKFREWHLPWPALWGLIIAMLFYLAYRYFAIAWLRTPALNILYLYYPLLLATGLSLVVWFRKTTGSLFMPIVLIIGIFIFPAGVLLAVMMFGFVDSIVDFRARYRKNTDKR